MGTGWTSGVSQELGVAQAGGDAQKKVMCLRGRCGQGWLWPGAEFSRRVAGLRGWGSGLDQGSNRFEGCEPQSLGAGPKVDSVRVKSRGGRGRRRSPEPKGGQSWQPRPQALPTRLQQQICLVMLRRMGSEQPPSRSTRKQGPLASEITCWARVGGRNISERVWEARGSARWGIQGRFGGFEGLSGEV